MFIQPVDHKLAVWFTLAALSTLYVAVDRYRNPHGDGCDVPPSRSAS